MARKELQDSLNVSNMLTVDSCIILCFPCIFQGSPGLSGEPGPKGEAGTPVSPEPSTLAFLPAESIPAQLFSINPMNVMYFIM